MRGELEGGVAACRQAGKQQRLGGGARLPKRHLPPSLFRPASPPPARSGCRGAGSRPPSGGTGDRAMRLLPTGVESWLAPNDRTTPSSASTSCSLAPGAVPPAASGARAGLPHVPHPVASPPVMRAFRGAPGDAGAAHGGRPAKGVSCARACGSGRPPPPAAASRLASLQPGCSISAPRLCPSCSPATPASHNPLTATSSPCPPQARLAAAGWPTMCSLSTGSGACPSEMTHTQRSSGGGT